MLEPAAQPVTRNQPRELQQIEAEDGPDILPAKPQARPHDETVEPDIRQAPQRTLVELGLQAESEIRAERPVQLARAAHAADAGAMKRRGRALARAGGDGLAVPEDGDCFALGAVLVRHALPQSLIASSRAGLRRSGSKLLE